MFSNIPRFFLTVFLLATPSHAEEEPAPLPQTDVRDAAIPGPIADGTPAAPAEKPAMPDFQVKGTRVIQLPDHKVTVRKVAPLPLPDLPPPLPALEITDPAVIARLAEIREKYRRTELVFVSATVYDHEKTFVRWWPGGVAGEEASGWSNLDFNHFSGFATYEITGKDGITRSFGLVMGIGNASTADLAARNALQGRRYTPPAPPQLPDDGPGFVVTKAPADATGSFDVMDGLHALYRVEGDRLKQAWEGREREAKRLAEFQRLNPPKTEDVEIFYWRKSR